MIFVVLGMHKSGTTLVSQMLHESGINMGEFETIDQDLNYDSGHKFERWDTQQTNREVLKGILRPPPDIKFRSAPKKTHDKAGYPMNDDAVAFVQQNKLDSTLLDSPNSDQIQRSIAACNARYTDWGFKDPRTCLTYPLWRKNLPAHKLIVVYRGFAPLLKRMLHLRRHRIPGLNLPRLYGALHAWTVHNSRILSYAEMAEVPTIVLNYDELMAGQTVYCRLCEFIGRPLVDARDLSLYRNRTETPTYLPPLARLITPLLPADPRQVYDELNQISKLYRQETTINRKTPT